MPFQLDKTWKEVYILIKEGSLLQDSGKLKGQRYAKFTRIQGWNKAITGRMPLVLCAFKQISIIAAHLIRWLSGCCAMPAFHYVRQAARFTGQSFPKILIIGNHGRLTNFSSGCSAARLAHHVRDVGVGSSNLLTPTT
jgi:hypothetical protein